MKLPTFRRPKKIMKKKISLPRRVVAIDLGSHALKMVEMQLSKKAEVRQMIYHPWANPIKSRDICDLLLQEDLLDELEGVFKQHQIKTRQVYLLASSNKLIVRYLDFPPMPEAELYQALQLQVAEQLPFEPENISYDFHILKQDEGGYRVVVFAAENNYIYQLLDFFSSLKKDVYNINVLPYAYWQVITKVYQPEEKLNQLIILVNLGASLSEVAIFHQSELILFRTISLGGNDFTQAVMQDEGLAEQDAERVKRETGLESLLPLGAVSETCNELFDQIWRSIQYVISRQRSYVVKTVYLTGGTALLKGLDVQLKQHIKSQLINFGHNYDFALEIVKPFAAYQFRDTVDLASLQERETLFALALGLAQGGV